MYYQNNSNVYFAVIHRQSLKINAIMTIYSIKLQNPTLATILLFTLLSCSSIGHHKVPTDSFNYNEVIGDASNQQMLLNLVRLRHYDVPVFLSINSVLTQYVYTGSLSADVTTANSGGFNNDSAGVGGRITYIERPTITYTPLAGQEFVQQLLEPIDRLTLFSLAHSGWPAEQIMIMGIERLGPYKNISIEPTFQNDEESLVEFVEVIQLLLQLSDNNAIEMRIDPEYQQDDQPTLALYFDNKSDEESKRLWLEFKQKLNLDQSRDYFLIANKVMGARPNELLIRSRSLLALMSHLAQGVDIGNQALGQHPIYQNPYLVSKLMPLTISRSSSKPLNAFVSVEYNNEWYFIDDMDKESKQAFGMLTYIYLLQSPEPPSTGPVLTVPTN